MGAGRWPRSEGELIAGAAMEGGSFAVRFLREGKEPRSPKEDVPAMFAIFSFSCVYLFRYILTQKIHQKKKKHEYREKRQESS